MSNDIGRRLLKAIRRKIVNPLKRRLANSQAAGGVNVEPAHGNSHSAKVTRIFPFSRRTQKLNGEKTCAVREYTATLHSSEQPSKTDEINTQRPPEDAKHAQNLRKCIQKTKPTYRQLEPLPNSTMSKVGPMVQMVTKSTSVTNLEALPQESEATILTEQHMDVATGLNAFIMNKHQDQANVQNPQPPHIQNMISMSADDKSILASASRAPRERRRRRRPASTHRGPLISSFKYMACFALLEEAQGYHTRVYRVRSAAESYARAFELEAAPRKFPHVVMGCTFNKVLGSLMVNLCTIVFLKNPDPELARRASNSDSRLIPIEPNKPNPTASPAQACFQGDELHFGRYGWIDTKKVYSVPVDLIKEGPHGAVKLCKCSWEQLRETLSMGTPAEEISGIAREFKRWQRKMKAGGVGPDYTVRMADFVPQRQSHTEPGDVPLPRLRRYKVEEILHLQCLPPGAGGLKLTEL